MKSGHRGCLGLLTTKVKALNFVVDKVGYIFQVCRAGWGGTREQSKLYNGKTGTKQKVTGEHGNMVNFQRKKGA